MTELQRRLFELQDKKYQAFHSKLIPNIEPAHVIGIRTPVLRNFAKAFARENGMEAFLQELPHTYYEENNLHMMLIGGIKDYAQCLYEVKRMLPYVDNWATCDFPVPKCFAKHKEELLPEIRIFLASGETYTIRYGIGLLMRLYLDADFKAEYPAMDRVSHIGGILCEYDDRVVFCYRTCQAVGDVYPIYRRAEIITVGIQKDDSEGGGKLPDHR